MIKRLKRKFIILATVSIMVLMTFLVIIMNLVNFTSVIRESDTVLDVVSQKNPSFFDANDIIREGINRFGDFLPRGMSPEVPYESRYFSVTVSSDGAVVDTDFSRIVSVDSADAAEYIEEAYNSGKERGFVGSFRYSKTFDGSETKIVFLDIGRKLDSFFTFLWISMGVGLLGCVIVFLVFLFASGKIIKPIAESYEKQKRFITDAGHEIKTPLTIISANVDLLESDLGDNDSLSDIRSQTQRLAKLTGDLVYLSKMDEGEANITKIEFPVSDIVSETANSFQALATAQNKEYVVRVQPSVSIMGVPETIRRLASILIDNAMKYSPDGGIVTVDMVVQKKTLFLSVFNTTKDLIEQEGLEHLFERFYRTDASRNSETGGHGIGLSVAQAIVQSYGGKITATTEKGFDFRITASIPM